MSGNIKFYNLTGGLNTVQGLGTINQSNRRTESPDMQNVEYYKLGGLKTMEGNTRVGNILPSKVTLGYEYNKQDKKEMIVFTADGTVYRFDKITQTFNVIYKFNSPSERHSACDFNQGIVFSNGLDDLVFYQAGRKTILSGTVTIEAGSSTLSGENTKFKSELQVGDYIYIEGVDFESRTKVQGFKVYSVDSDTSAVLVEMSPTSVSQAVYGLTNISECNAVLTNEDDPNVNFTIRGLTLQSYQGRLWVGGNDGTLYYSEAGLIHGWDVKYDAGGIPVFYNDNSSFTALIPWDKLLIICRREHSYLLDATNDDSSLWTIHPHSDYTCDSQQSYIIANNSLLVYSRTAGGIYPLLQRTIYNSLFQGTEASVKIRDSFDYINQARFDYIFPVYHPKKNYIMFYLPMITGVGSNECYIFDVKSKTWLKRKVPQEVSIAFRFNNEIYIGTTDGKILKEFSGINFDGTAIDWYWKSPWLSFGDVSDYKSTREFRVNLSEEYNNIFRVRSRRNGESSFKQRKVTNNPQAFQGLVWDVDKEDETITDTIWDEDSWVKLSQTIKRFPLSNQYFNTLQLEFFGDTLDEGFAINGFEILGIQLEEVGY